jgi:hypothetical protein
MSTTPRIGAVNALPRWTLAQLETRRTVAEVADALEHALSLQAEARGWIANARTLASDLGGVYGFVTDLEADAVTCEDNLTHAVKDMRTWLAAKEAE